MVILTAVLSVLLAGSLVYCLLVMLAARHYLYSKPSIAKATPPVSILKPLCGYDEGLEENLRSFFEQDYPEFEILFGAHHAGDPALAVARKIIDEYAGRVPGRIIITGESSIPNAKAYSLNRLVREAKHDLLVMGDSDIRAPHTLLRQVANELNDPADPKVGLITCPYRAIGGSTIWSRLEALGMNTELLGGVLVARMLEGMKFALGCTVAVKRGVLDAMGGFTYLQEFLAEDFVIGQRAAQLGYKVVLSSAVIEHRIGSQNMLPNLSHRLRWARSTRRSRPAGYWGQAFTYPVPLALMLLAVRTEVWPALLLTLALRTAAAAATSLYVVRDPLFYRQLWLLPVQDVLGFLVWIGGFLGDTIVWRDRKCTVLRDGRLQVN